MKRAVTVIVDADNDITALRRAGEALADLGAACESVLAGGIVIKRVRVAEVVAAAPAAASAGEGWDLGDTPPKRVAK